VIQHSMITKSIERAQKKVEENNFGIRKRLLEYDDVMNAQRDVIYKRRRNALFGDRLAIDIENAFADVATELAYKYETDRDFAAYQLECIRLFAYEPSIDEKTFMNIDMNGLTDSVFSDLKNVYAIKTKAISDQTKGVLQNIATNEGDKIINVAIPFTDGVHGMQAVANLKESLLPNSTEIMNALERASTLAMIDDAWKVHLRTMDELKQSVQMAGLEQKDPLLIYKLEAFNLFKEMIGSTNKSIVSFLFRSGIPMQNQSNIQEAQEEKTSMKGVRASHEEFGDDSDEQQEIFDTREPVKQEPIKRLEPKIGRNDLCPCGSGRKFKACHGQ
jgi:preprotein translocase subunit SecA